MAKRDPFVASIGGEKRTRTSRHSMRSRCANMDAELLARLVHLMVGQEVATRTGVSAYDGTYFGAIASGNQYRDGVDPGRAASQLIAVLHAWIRHGHYAGEVGAQIVQRLVTRRDEVVASCVDLQNTGPDVDGGFASRQLRLFALLELIRKVLGVTTDSFASTTKLAHWLLPNVVAIVDSRVRNSVRRLLDGLEYSPQNLSVARWVVGDLHCAIWALQSLDPLPRGLAQLLPPVTVVRAVELRLWLDGAPRVSSGAALCAVNS